MLLMGTNPFSHSDIAEIVREVVNKWDQVIYLTK
jgi:hypothetical protein